MTKPVVGRPFLSVGKNRICLRRLFEFVFRVRIVGIFVGMKFDREFAVGAFNFLAGRSAIDAEHFVVIAFGCCHFEK